MLIFDDVLAALFWLFVLATLVSSLWYSLARMSSPGKTLPQSDANRRQLSDKNQGVTVLICARNEAHNLRCYLPTVLEQISPTPFEVLVVDDASSDDTPQVLAFFQKQYAHLNVLRLAEKTFPGKKYALTQGIAAAKHDLLLLTDADCQPCSLHWQAAMSTPLRENPAIEIVLGYAPCGADNLAKPASWLDHWIRFETAHTAWTYFAFARMGLPYMGVGRNLALRKQAFRRVGGFAGHQHLSSGDDDLLVSAIADQRNTTNCLYPQAFVFSAGKKTWCEWYEQKRRHLSTGKLYRPVHRLLLGALALAHSGHYAALLVLTFSEWASCAWALWATRIVAVYLGWFQASRALREPRLVLYLPILDAMLGIYYGVLGLVLAFAKKQVAKW